MRPGSVGRERASFSPAYSFLGQRRSVDELTCWRCLDSLPAFHSALPSPSYNDPLFVTCTEPSDISFYFFSCLSALCPFHIPVPGTRAQTLAPIQSAVQNVFLSLFPEQSHPPEPSLLQAGSKRSSGLVHVHCSLATSPVVCDQEWLGEVASDGHAVPGN